jgi:hypothetical protein
VLGGLNLSHRNQTWTKLANGVGDKLSGFGLTFSFDDSSLHFLLAFEHDVLGSFSLLLSNLLGLNSFHEIFGELEICD